MTSPERPFPDDVKEGLSDKNPELAFSQSTKLRKGKETNCGNCGCEA
jgi:hypothetical protein